MDLESLQQQAEAFWPLGWEIDEDDLVVAASAGPIDIRLDYSEQPPTISVYNNEQPLMDAEPFEDLAAALNEAHAAWSALSVAVPPLKESSGEAAAPQRGREADYRDYQLALGLVKDYIGPAPMLDIPINTDELAHALRSLGDKTDIVVRAARAYLIEAIVATNRAIEARGRRQD